jgi:hypothetical protein
MAQNLGCGLRSAGTKMKEFMTDYVFAGFSFVFLLAVVVAIIMITFPPLK